MTDLYKPPTRPKGTMALIVGVGAILLSWTLVGGVVLGLVGIILGIVGIRRAKHTEGSETGSAKAAIVTGAVGLGLAVLMIVWAATHPVTRHPSASAPTTETTAPTSTKELATVTPAAPTPTADSTHGREPLAAPTSAVPASSSGVPPVTTSAASPSTTTTEPVSTTSAAQELSCADIGGVFEAHGTDGRGSCISADRRAACHVPPGAQGDNYVAEVILRPPFPYGKVDYPFPWMIKKAANADCWHIPN